MLESHNVDYGDQPLSRDERLRELLGDFRNYLMVMVRGLAPDDPSRHDDLVQEAYIAIWRALPRIEEANEPQALVKWIAKNKVLSLITDQHRHYTGNGGRPTQGAQKRGDETRERIKEFMREYTRQNGRAPTMVEAGKALGMTPQAVSKQMRKLGNSSVKDALVTAYRSTSIELLQELGVEPLQFAEKLDDIEIAYHYGEIHKAIAELPTPWREFVWLRFWGGLSEREAVESIEHISRGIWLQKIKPELKNKLSHLASIM